jgi:hypothetical protein
MPQAHRYASTWRRSLLIALAILASAVALFFAGRALAPHSIDFVVYYRAAQSLLAGRTDLYSPTFALDPPMRYLYPPVFVLLVAPLGLLTYENAFGLWFALLVLMTAYVLADAVRAWRPRGKWVYGLTTALLAGPALVYGLRSANVHLLVVLMTIAAVVAWGKGRFAAAAVLVSLAGAMKVFPLLLVPFLVALREWRLTARIALLSTMLWALPLAYFGPPRCVDLYGQWWRDVAGNVERLRRESRLDVSLESATVRWLSAVDYAPRIDRRYPQVQVVSVPPAWARSAGKTLIGVVALLTAVAVLRLRRSVADRGAGAAAAGSLCFSAQLLVGPYTTLLYLSGWLLPVLALPAAAAAQLPILPRLRWSLLALGIVNAALVLVPGAELHRALEAWGVYTLISAALWSLSLWVAWRFPRRHAEHVGRV